MRNLTFREIFDIFSNDLEILKIVNSNIYKLTKLEKQAKRFIWEYQYKYGGFQATFLSMMIDHLFPGGAHSLEVKRLKELRRFRDCVKAREWGDTLQPNIERARTVAINELIDCKWKNGKWWACCPLHKEKTASFMVNKDGRTAHCFSCGWHGDGIALVMKRDGLTFLEAVRYLNGYHTTPHAR